MAPTRRVILYRRAGPDIEDIQDIPMFWNDIYTGVKYQCVELARRYYLIKYGAQFSPVKNAKDIEYIKSLRHDSKRLAWPTIPNKPSSPPPKIGSLLLWKDTSTGHVAVVTHVGRDFVDIIEQNYGSGHRRIGMRDGVLVSHGLVGWKQPPHIKID